jgi:hypothetical protein
MSVKYFTGTNNSTSKNQTSDTAMTALGLCETEPVNNVDGMDIKPGTLSVYDRIRRKVYTKTTDSHGKSFANNAGASNVTKTRANRLIGKYDLGKMYKYRKTLKKLFTATGTAAASSGNKGHRNMFTLKGKGCASAKNTKAASTDNPLYPMDDSK